MVRMLRSCGGSGFVGLPGRGRNRHVAPTDVAPATVHTSRPMDLPFHTLDVFTDRTFGGNPLGVFPDAAHLPSDLMQRIAKEMNLSETVFLGPAETEEGTARVRIFTPGREVPFAGHPTVGSAIYLAAEAIGSGGVTDALDASGSGEITLVLEENVGPVPVDVKFKEGRPVFARFTTAVLPEHRPSPHTADALAEMIGLGPSDIGGTGPQGHEHADGRDTNGVHAEDAHQFGIANRQAQQDQRRGRREPGDKPAARQVVTTKKEVDCEDVDDEERKSYHGGEDE